MMAVVKKGDKFIFICDSTGNKSVPLSPFFSRRFTVAKRRENDRLERLLYFLEDESDHIWVIVNAHDEVFTGNCGGVAVGQSKAKIEF